MNLMNSIILLLACLSISFAAFGVTTPFTDFMTGTTNIQGIVSNMFTPAAILAAAGSIIASQILGSGALSIVLLIAPVIIALTSFFTMPAQLLNSGALPPELEIIYQGVWAILTMFLVLGTVGWVKGYD